MKRDTDHQELESLAAKELDQSVQDLDDHTLARLKSARRQAVDLVSKSNSRQMFWQWSTKNWLLPAGGFAATAVAVTLSVSIWVTEPNELDGISLEDMAMLGANEDLELFDELEFYQWLEDEKHSKS